MTKDESISFPEGKTRFMMNEVAQVLGVALSHRPVLLMLARQEPAVPFEVIGAYRTFDCEGIQEIHRRWTSYREKYPEAGTQHAKRGRPRRKNNTQLA